MWPDEYSDDYSEIPKGRDSVPCVGRCKVYYEFRKGSYIGAIEEKDELRVFQVRRVKNDHLHNSQR